jgi:hypothetical protein
VLADKQEVDIWDEPEEGNVIRDGDNITGGTLNKLVEKLTAEKMPGARHDALGLDDRGVSSSQHCVHRPNVHENVPDDLPVLHYTSQATGEALPTLRSTSKPVPRR